MTSSSDRGVSLAPFRAARYSVDADRLGHLLCPPYDVIDEPQRRELLAADADNAVGVILPDPADGDDRYAAAARRLDSWVGSGLMTVDPVPTLYVYEMTTGAGDDGTSAGASPVATRGLVGALELRDPADGVILPHEDTMAGPVADRLALMLATRANLEPIYLVYDGGGAATQVVESVTERQPVAVARTSDGMTHRLWAVTDVEQLAAVDADLLTRRALIADGHHRYATYREMQRRLTEQSGSGPWDRGLTLLVDTASYGPQVHAIHRVLNGLPLSEARDRAARGLRVDEVGSVQDGMSRLDGLQDFAAVLTDGQAAVVVSQPEPTVVERAHRAGEPPALSALDVTVLHRALVPDVWRLPDSVEAVAYAHGIGEAIAMARESGGTAVLLRPTPVDAVAAVAAAGGRMPRKSTLFTPKPASGLVWRRFADQG